MNAYLFLALTMSLTINGMVVDTDLCESETHIDFTEEGLFIGRGMTGVIITLNSGRLRSDLRHYVSHFDGSQSSIEALVPALGTGPLNSLLNVIGSEYPIDYRDAGIEAHRSNTF